METRKVTKITSVTIHTDTTEKEDIKVEVLTISESGRQFIQCRIGEVSLLISKQTALLLNYELCNACYKMK